MVLMCRGTDHRKRPEKEYQTIKTIDQRPDKQSMTSIKTKIKSPVAFREDVDCMAACPVHTDAGMFVQQAAQGDYAEGFLTARSPNPFASSCGRICAAPCEDNCRRGRIDKSVAIRSIKKYLCEKFGPESDHPETVQSLLKGNFPKASVNEMDIPSVGMLKKEESGRKVAIVGAGPSGLSCAHDLALLGYGVTVFEALEKAGGMMRYGIPFYRLPNDVLDKEIKVIESLGVEIRTNTPVQSIQSLFDQGYESVFIGVGCMKGRGLNIEGADLEGVDLAVDFLLESNRGNRPELSEKTVVIGGGLVALDAARDVRRGLVEQNSDRNGKKELTGNQAVHMACLESFDEMPANLSLSGQQELAEMMDEQIELHPSWGPKRIIGENGKVTAIELIRVLSVFDENGKFAPSFDEDNTKIIEAESVIFAIGQASDFSFIKEDDGVEVNPWGTIKIDPDTFGTSREGVYAGGDAAFGPRIMIDAVAHGKKAAAHIDSYLLGRVREKSFDVNIEVIPAAQYQMIEGYEKIAFHHPDIAEPEDRIGEGEVELSFSEEEVREQASRCLTCHTNPIYNGTLCILCGRCVDICPQNCLSFVPFDSIEIENGDKETVAASLYLDPNEELTVMIKDDDKCIRCGNCSYRCPTEAMTMERIIVEERPVVSGND